MYIREDLLNKIKEVFDVKPLQSKFFNTDIFKHRDNISTGDFSSIQYLHF